MFFFPLSLSESFNYFLRFAIYDVYSPPSSAYSLSFFSIFLFRFSSYLSTFTALQSASPSLPPTLTSSLTIFLPFPKSQRASFFQAPYDNSLQALQAVINVIFCVACICRVQSSPPSVTICKAAQRW